MDSEGLRNRVDDVEYNVNSGSEKIWFGLWGKMGILNIHDQEILS